MIVLKYQDSTTEKIFENARRNLSFWGWGGQTTFKKNRFRSKYGGFTKFVFHVFWYEWLHKPQDLKPQGILFYYAFITPLLRLYYARLVIAHFWLWVLILGPFSGSGKSHETPMPAKRPYHYPRDRSSTGGRKWVDAVFDVFGKWVCA